MDPRHQLIEAWFRTGQRKERDRVWRALGVLSAWRLSYKKEGPQGASGSHVAYPEVT